MGKEIFVFEQKVKIHFPNPVLRFRKSSKANGDIIFQKIGEDKKILENYGFIDPTGSWWVEGELENKEEKTEFAKILKQGMD